jgi:hypothetical protein
MIQKLACTKKTGHCCIFSIKSEIISTTVSAEDFKYCALISTQQALRVTPTTASLQLSNILNNPFMYFLIPLTFGSCANSSLRKKQIALIKRITIEEPIQLYPLLLLMMQVGQGIMRHPWDFFWNLNTEKG